MFVTGSNGNVGIGTPSTTAKLQVNGDVHIGSASNINSFGALQLNQTSNVDEEGIAVLSAAGGRSIRIWVDESQSYINSGNGGNGNIILNEGTGNVGIGNTNPPEALTVEGDISASGDLHIQGNVNVDGTFSPSGDLSISSGNVVLDSGQGIDFSTTSDASATGATMSSELLDDYEEGTWTPLLVSPGITSATVGVFSADYTKIGRVVHISAYIDTDTLNRSGADPVYIQQLPFTCKPNSYFAVHIGYAVDFSEEYPTAGYIENSGNGTRIVLTKRDASDGVTLEFTSNRLNEEDPDVNALIFSATYMI